MASKTCRYLGHCALLLVAIGGRTAGAQQLHHREGTPVIVIQALEARVRGWGGCTSVSDVAMRHSPFFGGLVIYEGSCVAEHGDTLHTTVGFDAEGVVFLFDSKASYNFLLARHPVLPGYSEHLVEYAIEALRLSGQLPLDAKVVRAAADLPPEIRDQLSPAELSQITPVQFASAGALRALDVVAQTSRALTRYHVLLQRNGAATAIPTVVWQKRTGDLRDRPAHGENSSV